MIGIGRLAIRGGDLIDLTVDDGGQWAFVSGCFCLLFSDFLVVDAGFGGGREISGGLMQQGCMQGCKQIWWSLDETRFQIIFLIRPHEMKWDFSLNDLSIFTFLHQTNTYATASSLKEWAMRCSKPIGFVSGGRLGLARFGGKNARLSGVGRISARMMVINEKTVCFELRRIWFFK
jgi:hypothetical protein